MKNTMKILFCMVQTLDIIRGILNIADLTDLGYYFKLTPDDCKLSGTYLF